jgi:hypothetical protein
VVLKPWLSVSEIPGGMVLRESDSDPVRYHTPMRSGVCSVSGLCSFRWADGLGAIASPRNSQHRASVSLAASSRFQSKKVSKSTKVSLVPLTSAAYPAQILALGFEAPDHQNAPSLIFIFHVNVHTSGVYRLPWTHSKRIFPSHTHTNTPL